MKYMKKILFIMMFFYVCSYSENNVKKGYWPTDDLFKPGNAIKISMFPDSTIMPNGIYPIDEKGFIDLPSIGLLNVNNMSEKQFVEICKKTYSGHLRYLEFRVRPMIRISCLGGFQQPGLYWINPKASLWEVIKTAGGPINDDAIKDMKLERDGSIVLKDLSKLFQAGNSIESNGIISGDQITVRKRERRSGAEVLTRIILPVVTSALSITMTSITIISLQ